MCKGNLSRVSLARSVTRPQATGFALQNRTNTKKDTLLRVFFRIGLCAVHQPEYYSSSSAGCKAIEKTFFKKIVKKVDNSRSMR